MIVLRKKLQEYNLHLNKVKTKLKSKLSKVKKDKQVVKVSKLVKANKRDKKVKQMENRLTLN